MALRGVYKITGIVDDPANILKAIFRASKLEYWVPSQENANALRMVVDFGENIQIIAKNETGPQFFHRPEVVVICCHIEVMFPTMQGVSQNCLHLVICCFEIIEVKVATRTYNIEIVFLPLCNSKMSISKWPQSALSNFQNSCAYLILDVCSVNSFVRHPVKDTRTDLIAYVIFRCAALGPWRNWLYPMLQVAKWKLSNFPTWSPVTTSKMLYEMQKYTFPVFVFRTKDSIFIASALDLIFPVVLSEAEKRDIDISYIVLKVGLNCVSSKSALSPYTLFTVWSA